MSVPSSFTPDQVQQAYDYVLKKLKDDGRLIKGQAFGQIFTSYDELARLFGWTIDDQYDGYRMGGLAGEISAVELGESGVMLSVLVVRKTGDKMPGNGFYEYAIGEGLMTMNDDRNVFFVETVNRLVETYGRVISR